MLIQIGSEGNLELKIILATMSGPVKFIRNLEPKTEYGQLLSG